jgi:NNP family nitrate/nitrite transporter-like MFS transporter
MPSERVSLDVSSEKSMRARVETVTKQKPKSAVFSGRFAPRTQSGVSDSSIYDCDIETKPALAILGPMSTTSKAVRIRLGDFTSVPMRAFHATWMAFFVCFFAWFAIAPLMPYVRDELGLTPKQIALANVAAVGVTIFARLLIGKLCDVFGPRRTYAGLLAFSAFPVMSIGLADTYGQFLVVRLFIGVVGASFVLTQYHTSAMFAPNVVGTANATAAGWGNLGGGVTQMTMPLVMAAVMALGVHEGAWRYAMVAPGLMLLVASAAYLRFTQDTPDGNYPAARPVATDASGGFLAAARDHRVWILALAYAGCFGVELTVNNNAALYFHDHFSLSAGHAAFLAGLHGMMNLFARALGGIAGDRAGIKWGLRGRVLFLATVLGLEAVALMAFSRAGGLNMAIGWLVVFSLFVEMSCGATYAVVPMVNRQALGSVSGIVGAGGNVGAVCFGLLFGGVMETTDVFFVMGAFGLVASFASTLVRFAPAHDAAIRAEIESGLSQLVADHSEAVDSAQATA